MQIDLKFKNTKKQYKQHENIIKGNTCMIYFLFN